MSCVVLPPVCQAQAESGQRPNRADLEAALSFEAPASDHSPGGWGGGPPGTIFADDQVVHGGRGSARLERRADSLDNFSTITKSIPIDFSGTSLELRGFLKTENVSDFAGLWMREDGESPALAFENMQGRQIKGSTPWTEYSIRLPVHSEARQLFFGVLVSGSGKVWADDLQLLLDGKPIWDAPRAERPKTPLDLDHQFDSGSGIMLKQLTAAQVENLATLGKVWGFLKYHHPEVTSGKLHWDYELFRVLPSILEAPDRKTANTAILQWITKLDPVSPCDPCAKLDASDLDFGPDLDWIANEAVLGPALSQQLRSIFNNRAPGRQFYVSKVPEVGNPSFNHEPGYPTPKLPDAGFQLLGLYRFWNIVEYWSPYRDIIGEDWSGVLTQFIPRITLAQSAEAYQRELLAFSAKVHDGHANLWASLAVRPPVGECQIPVNVRYIENLPVVAGLPGGAPNDLALKVGDIVTALDGVPISKLTEEWKQYYATSNEAARLRDFARYMTRGKCGDASIAVRRQKQDLKLTVKRVASSINDYDPGKHDLPGPAFRLLSKDVAYIKLSAVKEADCTNYVTESAGTKGLIIDIRNYPSEFVVFALGSHLVESETEFVRFTQGDLSNPGAFHWTKPLSLSPEKPHYSGKIVILVDESSMSQSEYTSMAFRSAHGAIVIGSTTSGADGNVSPFALPGGLSTMISGIGVFYPDKTSTQRTGIVPNIEVRPTIAGIRAGRDEVLEAALRQILGRQTPAAEIEKLARP